MSLVWLVIMFWHKIYPKCYIKILWLFSRWKYVSTKFHFFKCIYFNSSVFSALDAKYWKSSNQKNVWVQPLDCKSHAESKLFGVRYTAKVTQRVCNKTSSFLYTFLFTFWAEIQMKLTFSCHYDQLGHKKPRTQCYQTEIKQLNPGRHFK